MPCRNALEVSWRPLSSTTGQRSLKCLISVWVEVFVIKNWVNEGRLSFTPRDALKSQDESLLAQYFYLSVAKPYKGKWCSGPQIVYEYV